MEPDTGDSPSSVFLATFIESTRENYKNLLYPYEKHRYFK
jgi:hypothetical protein